MRIKWQLGKTVGKSLYVTDFDDTLAKTDSKVYIVHPSGERVAMTPGQYAVYNPKKGDKLDFSEFNQLINPRPINRYVELLKRVTQGKKADKVSILTARSHTKPIAKFLQMIGITGKVSIAALGDADPQAKAKYIEKHIKDGYDKVLFIDDSKKNVSAVKGLQKKYPNAKVLSHHVEEKGPKTGASAQVDPANIKKPATVQASSSRISKADLQKLYRSKIKNQQTGKEILLVTALKNKNHPMHNVAMGMLAQYARQKNPNK